MLQLNLAMWPWLEISLALSAAAGLWVLVRTYRRRFSHVVPKGKSWSAVLEHWLPLLAITAVAIVYYAAVVRRIGPHLGHDGLRDLMNGLAAARGGARPSYGPPIGDCCSHLSPVWYYLLSLPFRFKWLGALGVSMVVAQVLTVVMLFFVVRRLFDTSTALVASALFILSRALFTNYLVLQPGNLLPLFSILAVNALVDFQCNERSEKLVSCFFWTTMCVQLHAISIFLAPMLLAVALVQRYDARISDFAVALIGAIAINMTVIPALIWSAPAPAGQVFYRFIVENTIAIPILVVALAIAKPRWMTSRHSFLFVAAALGAWAIWFWRLMIESGFEMGRIRFLNYAVNPNNQVVASNSSLPGLIAVVRQLVEFSYAASADETLALAFGLAGIAVCSIAVFHRAETSGNSPVSPAHGMVVLFWLASTLIPGIVICARFTPFERYLEAGAVPWIIVVAVGVNGWWRLVAEGGLSKVLVPLGNRWIDPALAAVAVLVMADWLSPIVWAAALPFSVFLMPRRWRRLICALAVVPVLVIALWKVPERLYLFTRGSIGFGQDVIEGLLRLPDVDLPALDSRIHGSLDILDTHGVVAMLPFAQLAIIDEKPPENTHRPGAIHYRIQMADDAAYAPREGIRLGHTGLRAIPFRPALHYEDIKPVGTMVDCGGSQVQQFELPWRSVEINQTTYPPSLTPRFRIAPSPLAPGRDGLTVGIDLKRDQPVDPTLNGIELAIMSTAAQYREQECDVTLFVDEKPIPAERINDGPIARWRFRLPAVRSQSAVRLMVKGCHLTYLDLYDVPLSESRAGAPS